MEEKLREIEKKLSVEDLLLQLAEECAELSQACLKMVRADKGTAYKPYGKCLDNLAEEMADVEICMRTINDTMLEIQTPHNKYVKEKIDRWNKRVCGE